MKEPLRILQIGTGGWGWSWIQVVQESPDWELAGIVDLSADARKKACEYYGIEGNLAFDTLQNALSSVLADAALVVVPPEAHADVTIEALKSGLHCLVEKPISHNIEDAKRMIKAADRTGMKLMVSQNYRFKRAPQTVKWVIGQGIIGEIGSVYVNFQKSPPFTGFRAEMEEPLITDMSIHHFDQMRGILGLDPVKVLAYSWNPKWTWFKGNPVATVIFEMNNGAVITYTGSWVSRGWETTWDGEWRIQGDGGEIYWGNNRVIVHPTDIFKSVFVKGALEADGDMHCDLLDLPAEERWASLAEFAGSIFEDREPETSGKDNIKTLAMVIGARRSREEGKPVTIEEMLSV